MNELSFVGGIINLSVNEEKSHRKNINYSLSFREDECFGMIVIILYFIQKTIYNEKGGGGSEKSP